MKSTLRKMASAAAVLAGFLQGSCLAAAPGAQSALDTTAVADCNWNHPGANPFMGDVVAAVDRYQDITPEVRARLKARMARREYDEIVEIRRDSISGRNDYGSEIADMHFGTRQLCHRVTRTAWSPQMQERGLVYCEQDQCLLVPTVCRNVSRIQRRALHSAPVLAVFVPAPLDSTAPGSNDEAPELLRAGPIGWAPAGSGGTVAVGGPDAAGSTFAQEGGGGGGGASGGGAVYPLSSRVGLSNAVVAASSGPRQSARIVSIDTERGGLGDNGQPAIAAPVPEPGTWTLMAFGLLVLVRLAARRR